MVPVSARLAPSRLSLVALLLAICAGTAGAQTTSEEDSLKVYFSLGSARIPADQRGTVEQAARTFRQGDPFVMILQGGTDTTGPPALNLELSIDRARAVAEALAARGIPIGRLQVLGRGASELQVDTPDDTAERQNRVVEITWR